ncbi:DUF1566 domain-containing protein [Pseudomonas denitrificans (nom. rej.)]|uniref:DUF1566 domain-containing protein n=1 Tax=Pseudomonas denitrificans TaxID=43306 RepID=A0A9X7R2K7_PSEDE|nr:DUF1566 domain-containing protein [Pseudomonas denitrificans (nom. rej.)]QEY70476.1 DUF1566 domain-containing protein [Pseudomonas denitrificans (nom. rej.)]
MTITTIKAAELPAIGQALADGIFAYHYWLNGSEYALIDLGAEREFVGEWGEYDQDVEGATSYRDGAANTVAMVEAGSPIAKQAMELGEGVFIPSALELAGLYAAKQASEIGGFQDRWYWSSSQSSAHDAFLVHFRYGWPTSDGKSTAFRVRPVRKILILQ